MFKSALLLLATFHCASFAANGLPQAFVATVTLSIFFALCSLDAESAWWPTLQASSVAAASAIGILDLIFGCIPLLSPQIAGIVFAVIVVYWITKNSENQES